MMNMVGMLVKSIKGLCVAKGVVRSWQHTALGPYEQQENLFKSTQTELLYLSYTVNLEEFNPVLQDKTRHKDNNPALNKGQLIEEDSVNKTSFNGYIPA